MEKGEAVSKRTRKAKLYLEKSAAADPPDPDAVAILANSYHHGVRGCKPDLSKALALYEKARHLKPIKPTTNGKAEIFGEDIVPEYQMAVILAGGGGQGGGSLAEGVNMQKAAALYRAASAKGCLKARCNLAQMLLTEGYGQLKRGRKQEDEDEAIALYQVRYAVSTKLDLLKLLIFFKLNSSNKLGSRANSTLFSYAIPPSDTGRP